MTKLVSKQYKLDYYDHLNDKPLLNGDMVLATFQDGFQLRTMIVNNSRGVASSPSGGDVYENEACIAVLFHGISIRIPLRNSKIEIKRD